MTASKPLRARLVLAAAIIPGAGHVVLGIAQRGLVFIFFMLVLGWVSYRLMPETASFFGRRIGGVLIYGFSILDAYRIARYREVTGQKSANQMESQ